MTASPICRTALCSSPARGELGFCAGCLIRYRSLHEAEHAARTSMTASLLEQIPLVPGLTPLHRKALAARAAVYALRAGAAPGAELEEIWLDLAFVDLAEDLAQATRRVSDLWRLDTQLQARPADVTETALDPRGKRS